MIAPASIKKSSIILYIISPFEDVSSSEKHPQLISSPLAKAEIRAIRNTINDIMANTDDAFLYIPVINKIPVKNSTHGITIAIILTKYIGKNSYLKIAFAKSSALNSFPTEAYMNIIPSTILNDI